MAITIVNINDSNIQDLGNILSEYDACDGVQVNFNFTEFSILELELRGIDQTTLPGFNDKVFTLPTITKESNGERIPLYLRVNCAGFSYVTFSFAGQWQRRAVWKGISVDQITNLTVVTKWTNSANIRFRRSATEVFVGAYLTAAQIQLETGLTGHNLEISTTDAVTFDELGYILFSDASATDPASFAVTIPTNTLDYDDVVPMLPTWGYVSAVWSAGIADFFAQRSAQSIAANWTTFPNAAPPVNTLTSLGGIHVLGRNMPIAANTVTHSISSNESGKGWKAHAGRWSIDRNFRPFNTNWGSDGVISYAQFGPNLNTGSGVQNMLNLININNTFTISYWQRINFFPPTGAVSPYLINSAQSDFFVPAPWYVSYAQSNAVRKQKTWPGWVPLAGAWTHFTLVVNGLNPATDWKAYVNSIDLDSVFTPSVINNSNANLTAVSGSNNSLIGATRDAGTGAINQGNSQDIADFIILEDTALTAIEVRQLFLASNNSGNGAAAGDYSQYPARVLANRILHVPGNKTLIGPLRLEDISGYGNHISILGEATVTQRNFY